MGYEPSHTAMLRILSHYKAPCAVWCGRVKLGVLAKLLFELLFMAIDILPHLGCAINEIIWSNTDYFSIFFMKSLDPYMLSATQLIDYLRQVGNRCKFRTRIIAERMEK